MSYDHQWVTTHTENVGGALSHQKFSQKKCQDCGATFIHFYDVIGNFGEALHVAKIDPLCKKQFNTGTAFPIEEQANQTLRLIAIAYSQKKGSDVCIRSFYEACECTFCHPVTDRNIELVKKALFLSDFRNGIQVSKIGGEAIFAPPIADGFRQPPESVECIGCGVAISEQAFSSGHGTTVCDSYCLNCTENREIGSPCALCSLPIEWWRGNKRVARKNTKVNFPAPEQ